MIQVLSFIWNKKIFGHLVTFLLMCHEAGEFSTLILVKPANKAKLIILPWLRRGVLKYSGRTHVLIKRFYKCLQDLELSLKHSTDANAVLHDANSVMLTLWR